MKEYTPRYPSGVKFGAATKECFSFLIIVIIFSIYELLHCCYKWKILIGFLKALSFFPTGYSLCCQLIDQLMQLWSSYTIRDKNINLHLPATQKKRISVSHNCKKDISFLFARQISPALEKQPSGCTTVDIWRLGLREPQKCWRVSTQV